MKLIPTFVCPRHWESMNGDEARRFCEKCGKHVHNLERLSVGERLKLLEGVQGICGRYRAAVIRPRLGTEEEYFKRLAVIGGFVALGSAAVVTLWQSESGSPGGSVTNFNVSWPGSGTAHVIPTDLYETHEAIMLGMIAVPEVEPVDIDEPKLPATSPYIRVEVDDATLPPRKA